MEKGFNTGGMRKVRKGTQSCWECKRRKIRCTFATPRNSVCDGCKSRQTRCIGQEYEDETASNACADDRRLDSPIRRPAERGNEGLRAQRMGGPKRNVDAFAPVISNLDLEKSGLESTSRALILEWPNDADLDLILSAPVGVSALLHGLICQPYAELFAGGMPTWRDVLQPPHQEMHPVLVARKLLLLASLLQSLPTPAVDALANMSSSYRDVMSRAFNAAVRLVTTNDELITTLEGIECVMMESMYLNNAGSLRRAWLVNRRAMSIAQMLRLHVADEAVYPIATLKRETRSRIDPKYLWFRLVVSDRYLSLMLGLPQGTAESSFAEPKMLDGCTALERMERAESAATGLFLQLNSKERVDLNLTQKLDQMVRDAAALMPPQWWFMNPALATFCGDSAKEVEESVRLTTQFAHYHLLVQIHLPYMLLPYSQQFSYDYNRMIAASSSREVLVRFVACRSANSAPAYCRGIDFIAFVAGTALCLAHMQAMRPRGVSATCTTFQSIRHQRSSDRGLLERTVELMETMAIENDDAVARSISSILKPLLAIESNSVKGGFYYISVSAETALSESQPVGDSEEGFDKVSIQVPYCGTIRIEHRPVPSSERVTLASQTETAAGSMSIASNRQGPFMNGGGPQPTHLSDYENIPRRLAADACLSPEPIGVDQLNEIPLNKDFVGSENEGNLASQLTLDLDDWVLEGVDLAFFNNLAAWEFGFGL
ncbi:hypothetical protein TWF481_010882 [Arthrobotrys musiformis]|uniref:Zn(2)-C6 fungal-type domain-containing protein n=1 Tax=Arthrobotrys musiformis TaxID=47236 RepID=A0AAV9VZL9_9PEZI